TAWLASTCIRAYKPVTVSTTALPKDSGPEIRFSTPKSVSGRADSLIPKVGHLGTSSAGRSKTETGKFDSSPPATSQAGFPSAFFHFPGRKKNGIEVEARTAATT